MYKLTYVYCALVIGLAATLFWPLFVFFAVVFGILAVAAVLF